MKWINRAAPLVAFSAGVRAVEINDPENPIELEVLQDDLENSAEIRQVLEEAVKDIQHLVVDEDGMAKLQDDRVPEWETVYLPDHCPYKTEIGDTLAIHYYGALADEGEEFGASYRTGELFEFVIHEDTVIKGWVEPLLGMCPGEKRHIEIPSDYGYGDLETIPGIPADSDLITDVELVWVKAKSDGETYEMLERELVSDPTYVPPGCEYHAKEGDTLYMEYHGTLESNGKVFDSSYHRGGTFDYTIGRRQAIQGWEKGMLGICAGERRHLIIPASYAYGNQGTGSGSIPPGDSLVQDVKCVKIETADGEIFEAEEETTIDGQESLYKPKNCIRSPQMGDKVWVAYDGRLEATPEIIFDTSLKHMYGRTHPFVFTIGANQAIEGFEMVIKDMCLGEKMKAVIPPGLAYGRRGDGMIIPPDARLDYIVEIIRIDDEDGKAYYAEPEHIVTKEAETCDQVVQEGDVLQVQWFGYLQVTFEGFQSSDHNQNEVIHLGKDEVFSAIEDNLIGMCVSEKRQIILPQESAFGAEGHMALKIPPYASLVYDIELINIVKHDEL